MGKIIRKIVRITYTRLIKPALFKVHPDIVHKNTVRFARAVQKSRIVLYVTRKIFTYEHKELLQTIYGIEFKNPVGLSAGFDKNVQLAPLMEAVGFGFVTAGSVTGRRCAGNAKPWFHRLPKEKSLVVNVGLANPGSRLVANRMKLDKKTASRTVPLMISVARTNDNTTNSDESGIDDYVLGLKNLAPYPELFEINISCPNTYGGEPFTDPTRLEKLLKAIEKLQLSQPVFIKMPSNMSWAELDILLAIVVRHDIQGVTICNLRKTRDGISVDSSVKGNLSGKPVQQLSDELIEKTYKKYGSDLIIIGVGGVFTAEDAYRKITLGASMVALVTGMIFEGPSIVGDINEGLAALLRKDGYNNISQAIGSGVK